MNPISRIALLDRDGTLIEHIPYLADASQVRLLPEVAKGLRALRDQGFALVMVSNQSGLGRGFFNESQLHAVHAALELQLAQEGLKLDRLYYCPHHPDEHCRCRKPNLALAEKASQELHLPLQDGIVVGDAACDMGLAKNLGWPGFLLPDSAVEAQKSATLSWQTFEDYQPGYRRISNLGEVSSLLEASRVD